MKARSVVVEPDVQDERDVLLAAITNLKVEIDRIRSKAKSNIFDFSLLRQSETQLNALLHEMAGLNEKLIAYGIEDASGLIPSSYLPAAPYADRQNDQPCSPVPTIDDPESL